MGNCCETENQDQAQGPDKAIKYSFKQKRSDGESSQGTSEIDPFPKKDVAVSQSSMNPLQKKTREVLHQFSTFKDVLESKYSNLPEGGPYFYKLTKATYKGQFSHGKKTGLGKCIYKDGSLYEGYWVNDQKEGTGRFIDPNGNTYDGFWSNNLREGKGTSLNYDGTYYSGTWRLDQKGGYGEENYSDKRSYRGQFFKNQKHGNGHLTWGDHKTYEGQFKNDKIEGIGLMTWPNGDTFEGTFHDGKKGKKGVFKKFKKKTQQ